MRTFSFFSGGIARWFPLQAETRPCFNIFGKNPPTPLHYAANQAYQKFYHATPTIDLTSPQARHQVLHEAGSLFLQKKRPRVAGPHFYYILFKSYLIILTHVHFNLLSSLNLALNDLQRQIIQNLILDHALEWASAKLRIKTFI